MTFSILYMVHSKGLVGGAPLSLGYLLERLDRHRYEPCVVCIYNAPDVLSFFRERQIEATYYHGISIAPHTTGGWYSLTSPMGAFGLVNAAGRFWPSVRAAEELFRTTKPDIVHLNSLVLAPAAIGAKRAGVKLVWHIRESVHPGHFGLRRRWLQGLVSRLADEAIFITDHDRQQLVGTQKGIVVHELVDFTRFDRSLDGMKLRQELGIPCAAKVVMFMGGVSHLKGADVLLAALPQIKIRIPNLRVVIAGAAGPRNDSLLARSVRKLLPLVGSGTERQRFETLFELENLHEYVHLLSFRRDPEMLMAAADVIVIPSTQPHFGMPAAEAGAMAKPVVASQIGALEEAVVENETGLLVPPNDPEALADAIIRVLADSQLAQRLGEGGYQNSLTKFNIETNAQLILDVYDRLIGGIH